ncbi:MAG: 16S rRNA (adenine(1518)-N(6)/adenine(1519)-N(6))-dimethyltransferase RsmA [Pseudomonadota bacterium]
MTRDDGLPPLREVIARHDLAARKAFGQNFLLDLNLTRKIARAAGPFSDAPVLEIGPGPGGLTRALLAEGARRVIAVERDARCAPALDEIAAAYPGRLEFVLGDALDTDEAAQIGFPPNLGKIVANLPYNIATPLLVKWLAAAPRWWSDMTLMFQKEVAERICASPGGKVYGRLSVLAQTAARPRLVLELPARAFTPPPKVASAVVRFEPREPQCPLDALEKVTAAAFGQRRKMLRTSLKPVFGAAAGDVIAACGLQEDMRAEAVDVAGYGRLANHLANPSTARLDE